MRRRFLAALLSLLAPGVGQLYSGRVKKAVWLYGLYTAMAAALYTGLLGRSLATLGALVVALLALQVTAAVLAAVQTPAERPEPRRWFTAWYGALAVFVVLVAAQSLVQTRLKRIKTFVHQSASMEPTIYIRERLMAALDAYSERDPRRGELALFEPSDESGAVRMKRVVAVGGDTIEIRGKQLIVNGTPAVEPWAVHRHEEVFPTSDPPTERSRRDNLEPYEIPTDHFFVLGDNRDYSYDSRFHGPVPRTALKGAPLYLYWSSDFSRIGQSLEAP